MRVHWTCFVDGVPTQKLNMTIVLTPAVLALPDAPFAFALKKELEACMVQVAPDLAERVRHG